MKNQEHNDSQQGESYNKTAQRVTASPKCPKCSADLKRYAPNAPDRCPNCLHNLKKEYDKDYSFFLSCHGGLAGIDLLCPKCAKPIAPDSHLCANCLTNVDVIAEKNESFKKAREEMLATVNPTSGDEADRGWPSGVKEAEGVACICSKCGAPLAPNAKYCSECASPTQTTTLPQQDNKFERSTSNPNAAQIVVDVVLALLALMPWVSIDLVFYSRDMTLLSIFTSLNDLTDLMSSYSSSDTSGLTMIAYTLGAIWLFYLIGLAYDVYKRVAKGIGSTPGLCVSACAAFAAIAICFIASLSLSNSLGSYSAAVTLGPTLYAWVAAIGCTAAAIWCNASLKKR